MGRDYRGTALRTVRYAIGLAALAWVALQAEWGRIAPVLIDLSADTIGILIAVTILGLVSRFYTWQILMERVSDADLRAAGSVDLAVNFINQLFPSRLSGRSAAPLVLRHRTGMAWSSAVAVAGVHTGVYAVLYGMVAAAGIALGYDRFGVGIGMVIAISTGLYFMAGVLLLGAGTRLEVMDRLESHLERLLARLPVSAERREGITEKLPDFTANSAATFRDLSGNRSMWIRYAFAWTIAIALVPGVRVWILLSAFGSGFESAILLPAYLVAAYSVTLLPLTPGGIGITEATATLVFIALGVPSGVIIPVIFIDRFLGVYLPALAGGIPALRVDFGDLITE